MWKFASLGLASLLLISACSTVDTDRNSFYVPAAVQTRISFEPLDRQEAERYLETERHTYKLKSEPLLERKAALARGREERYHEIRSAFPECRRQKHCLQNVSRGDIKKFERYNDLAKEIYAYDRELAEIDASLREWKSRLALRSRAIVNRFLVHEVLQLPKVERRFQGVLVYSLESFETRRQMALHLLRYAGDNVIPRVLGDYAFRMLGQPVDEGAVLATFEVYLMPSAAEPSGPTRYVVTMLVNTHQLDLRYYEQDFLRAWATKFAEPFQSQLREEVYCGMYSIASDTLAPRLDLSRPKKCAETRSLMQTYDSQVFSDRFSPDHWLLPIAYYPMSQPGS